VLAHASLCSFLSLVCNGTLNLVAFIFRTQVSFVIKLLLCHLTCTQRLGSMLSINRMSVKNAEQLVLVEMHKDPAQCHGVCTIQQKVAYHSKTHLTQYMASLQVPGDC